MSEFPEITIFAGPMASGKTTALYNLVGEFNATNIEYQIYKPRLEIRNKALQPRGIPEESAVPCEIVNSLEEIDTWNLSLNGIHRVLLEEFQMFGYNNDRTENDINLEKIMRIWAENEITHVYGSGLDLAASGNTFQLFRKAHQMGAKILLFESRCEFPLKESVSTCRKPARNTQIFSKSADKSYRRESLPDLLPEGDDPDRGYRAVCMSHFLLKEELTIEFK